MNEVTETPRELIARVSNERFGFLQQPEIDILAADDTTRLTQVLVRCGACRFVCATQDVAHLVRCVVAGGDYVRDVSLYTFSSHYRS